MVAYKIKNGKITIEFDAFHPQVLDAYPFYDPDIPSPGIITDYGDPGNVCGHTQRAFLNYYGIRAFLETGLLGLELGSAGVSDAFCLSTDHIATGEVPVYGGEYKGVQLAVDATNLSQFGSDSFGCVIHSHLCEHLPCSKITSEATQEDKYRLQCMGKEIAKIIDNHWLRVIKSGGYLAMIIPDERPALRVGSSTLYWDSSHNHCWTPDRFHDGVLLNTRIPFEIVKFDTLKNNFSFDVVLKKM